MRHTESNLRTLLDTYAHDATGREPVAHLDVILRRGRRMRRTRRSLNLGAALAVAATAVTAAVVLTGPDRTDQAAAAQPPNSARIETPPELPEKFLVVRGAERFTLPLIHSQRFGTTGVRQTVTFTPTSVSTGYKVVCADPRAWVVVWISLKGGESGGTSGRCGAGVGGHQDRLSAPAKWLKGRQTIQVWVFPSDAPVVKVAEELGRCRAFTKTTDTCDEQAARVSLPRPDVLERLSAEVGEQPGGWSVGVYDRPAADPTATSDPTAVERGRHTS
ncbi:hypothetical protein ACFFV7_12240 [Nonomuraea spiralis]|uniref:Uncharacterized protein n=1 Tax=Nonomuraea spiralis TaxID=46182 RepID=A0ABV5IBQ9_9ACTN|nr:hypothetical protein [Nonomuraea spiralis]GGS79913.1 hypothetical protein GCM10010176_024130 [Nonomuraea spiralis]